MKKKYAVLSMDVEDWFHLDYFKKEECDTSQSTMDGLDIYLKILDQYNIKATFFVVGEMVSSYKEVLKKVIENGHEIALHSYQHIRPLKLNIEQFKEDTENGYKTIKEALGIEAKGYRAPCFSLDRERLEILKEKGFVYDSSKIRFDAHDLYGNIDLSGFNQIQNDVYVKDEFYEFEASTVKYLGKTIPVSGGGYLRIFPWELTKFLLNQYFKTNSNYFFYIHPFEFSKNYNVKEPYGTDFKTKIRFRTGRKSVEKKMHKLIKLLQRNGYQFVRFEEIINR